MLEDDKSEGKGETERFVEALLAAYPTRAELERLAKFGLGKNLHELTSNTNARHDVFELVRWAESQSDTDKLLRAACQRNPGNAALRAFAESVRGSSPLPPSPPASAAVPEPSTDVLDYVLASLLGFVAGFGVATQQTPWKLGLLLLTAFVVFVVRELRHRRRNTAATTATTGVLGFLAGLRESAPALAVVVLVGSLTGMCARGVVLPPPDVDARDARVEVLVDAAVVALTRDVWVRDVAEERGDDDGGDLRDDASHDGNVVVVARGSCPTGMVHIPAGDPLLGDPATRRHVDAYCIDRTEVTVRAFRSWAVAHPGAATPTERSADSSSPGHFCNWTLSPAEREEHPINCVDWNEAGAYCRGTGGSLPSDDQWEYAARGLDGRTYPWEGDWDERRACFHRTDGTCVAGSTAGDASPFVVLDLAGNVKEWTESRSVRGASWDDAYPGHARAAVRVVDVASYRGGGLGFRCVRGSR